VAGVDYRYELRCGEEVAATGHLSREEPLEVGERLEISGQQGIVRVIEPLLGEHELRLVVQLVRDRIYVLRPSLGADGDVDAAQLRRRVGATPS